MWLREERLDPSNSLRACPALDAGTTFPADPPAYPAWCAYEGRGAPKITGPAYVRTPSPSPPSPR